MCMFNLDIFEYFYAQKRSLISLFVWKKEKNKRKNEDRQSRINDW